MGHPESFRGVDIETHCRGIGLNLLEWCSPPVWEQWFPTHGDAAVPGENYFWKRSLHGLLHTAFSWTDRGHGQHCERWTEGNREEGCCPITESSWAGKLLFQMSVLGKNAPFLSCAFTCFPLLVIVYTQENPSVQCSFQPRLITHTVV